MFYFNELCYMQLVHHVDTYQPASLYMHYTCMYAFCSYICFVLGPHKGIPNVLMSENNQAKFIDPSLLPEADDAVRMYEAYGGQITLFGNFGSDPLLQRSDLSKVREERFFEQYPTFDNIFHAVVNNDSTLFRNGLLYFIDVSMQLKAQL